MDRALQAISVPHRRQILRLLQDGEQAAGEIAAHFLITRPAVSQHLKVLREAGLVTERREGTRRLYRLRPEGMDELLQFLGGFREGRLRLLKKAEEEERRVVHSGDNESG